MTLLEAIWWWGVPSLFRCPVNPDPTACDIALVGVPGEMYARLGLELRRRSPFRHTCIIGLANEQIGYIPDRKAYADGGYQTWVGWHSKLEVGTGEAMVDEAVAMLDELYKAAPQR